MRPDFSRSVYDVTSLCAGALKEGAVDPSEAERAGRGYAGHARAAGPWTLVRES